MSGLPEGTGRPMSAAAARRLREAADRLHAAGLCLLPAARKGAKKSIPLKTWKEFQSRLPTEAERNEWFDRSPNAICIVCGAVSGNLEVIDFDLGGVAFDEWWTRVTESHPGLYEKLTIETTPSGGKHVIYRCEAAVSGNAKLAQRRHEAEGPDEIEIGGKRFQPRKDPSGAWHVDVAMIETRGEGGVFLCAPSPGYEVVQGSLTALPLLTVDERDVLLGCAWALNELQVAPLDGPDRSRTDTKSELRPGDDFNARGDVRETLLRHGWSLDRAGENEHWRRPGKSDAHSATLKGGVFYCFSSNASPFEPNRAYSPFAVMTLLDHHGDFAAAARALSQQGFGNRRSEADTPGIAVTDEANAAKAVPSDPGPVPLELLRVPGFISEVMDHCLEIAPYPNQTLAFSGALVLQAFLAGRKVRDAGDNRSNLYVLGLAHSSAGKDFPRKLNARILQAAGLGHCLGERLASGEGIEDALNVQPCMLVQTDEIDGLLQAINRSKEARHESVMSTLLTLYSASSSIYPLRRKAGSVPAGVIDQPCLVLLGTAIPNHWYEALSARMLTNGFFARMLILESGPRGPGQEPSIRSLPAGVVETARSWARLGLGAGGISGDLSPRIVGHTEEAKLLLTEMRQAAEAEYSRCESMQDPVGTTVWGRTSELVRKLALIYAVSQSMEAGEIGGDAVRWATRLVVHQTRRMLFMAEGHVAENPFDALCLRVIEKLRNAPNRRLSHSVLLKRMKVDIKTLRDIIDTLEERRELRIESVSTGGRVAVIYHLVEKSQG